MGQCGRPGDENRPPGELMPGQRPGVIDVDTGMQPDDLSPAYQPSDIVVVQTSLEDLPARDDPGLVGETPGDERVHEQQGRGAADRASRRDVRLWNQPR